MASTSCGMRHTGSKEHFRMTFSATKRQVLSTIFIRKQFPASDWGSKLSVVDVRIAGEKEMVLVSSSSLFSGLLLLATGSGRWPVSGWLIRQNLVARRAIDSPKKRTASSLFYSDRDKTYLDGHLNHRDDTFGMKQLQGRLRQLRIRELEVEFRRPPNPDLSPTEFIQACLHGMLGKDDPLPDSGARLLLRVSTRSWKQQLYRSVGAPRSAIEETVASALGEAISRPNNQFAILAGEEEPYVATFPTDALDYADGSCWVECQLRGTKDNKLLVIIGWQLLKEDGAWMIDSIEWQDFRYCFRPGIGREEWIRICG